MVNSRRQRAYAFAIFVAMLPAAVSAQTRGEVSGVIRGEQGRLAGAIVTLTGPVTKAVTSAADGTFSIDGLPAGTYRVSVVRGGYRTTQDTVMVGESGATDALVITLDPANLTSIQTIGRISTASRALAVNTTPAAVSTVTQQTYEDRGQFQVQNILEEQPGVELTRASSVGAPGANTDVAIRGADPYETQTLIDGHPVSSGSAGAFLIQFLNPLVLSDIEVTKGPGATGNTIRDAIGGTVNFRTLPIATTETAKATFGYDSYNGGTEGIKYSNTFGKIGVLLAYGRYATAGYYNGSILSVSADGPANAASVPNAVVNTAIPSTEIFDNKSELAKIAYNVSPSTSVTLGYFGSQSYVDYTGTLTTVEPVHIVGGGCAACAAYNNANAGGPPLYNNPAFANLAGRTVLASTTQDNLYLGNYETDNEPIFTADVHTTAGPGTLLARYFAGSITRAISDPQEANQITACNDPTCSAANASLSGAYYQREVDRLHGGDIEYDVPLGSDALTLAYDTYSDQAEACSGGSPLFTPRNCSLRNVRLFANTLSARANVAVGAKTTLTLANYFSNTSQVGSRYDPRLGIVYRATSALALRASAGTSYAAPYPDIAQHISQRTLYLAQALKPESSFSYDVGADLATNRTSKFVVDLYNTVIHDRFVTVSQKIQNPAFGTVSYTYNQADTRDAGLEFGFVHAPAVGVGGSASIDFLRSYAYGTNFLTNPFAGVSNTPGQAGNYGNQADGSQVYGYPYSHGRLELTYTFASRLQVATGATVYGADNSYGQAGFSLFDARASLPLQRGLQLTLSAQNLFNHDRYRTLGQYAYGYAPLQDAGAVANRLAPAYNPQTLGFATPRTVTLQVSKKF